MQFQCDSHLYVEVEAGREKKVVGFSLFSAARMYTIKTALLDTVVDSSI